MYCDMPASVTVEFDRSTSSILMWDTYSQKRIWLLLICYKNNLLIPHIKSTKPKLIWRYGVWISFSLLLLFNMWVEYIPFLLGFEYIFGECFNWAFVFKHPYKNNRPSIIQFIYFYLEQRWVSFIIKYSKLV